MGHNEQLGDAVPAFQPHRFSSMVDEDDLDLTPIPTVDDAGSIDHADAEPSRQPAAGRHETDVTLRDRNGQPRGDEGPLPRLECEALP